MQNFCIYTFARVFRNYPNPAKQHEICQKLASAIGIDLSVIHHACLIVASLQILEALLEYGDDSLRDMLKMKPEKRTEP